MATKLKADFSFVTYRDLPDLDPDDQIVRDELLSLGYSCRPVVWDDPEVDWHNSGICLVRSTWDYHLKYNEFQRWLAEVSEKAVLLNPFELLAWNARKTYLNDLSRGGVPVVPTVVVEEDTLAEAAQSICGWDEEEIIVKPSVGLATHGVARFSKEATEPWTAHARGLLPWGPVLVQPYMASVEGYGERALVFLGGTYSHAVRKTAFQPLRAAGQAGETPADASEDEIRAANLALSHLNPQPFYARVDLVRDSKNQPRLIELELIEPSLFFAMCPGAAARFARQLISFAEQSDISAF